MYQGTHDQNRSTEKRCRLRVRKELVLLAAVLVLLLGVVGGTLAYLVTNTGPITNTFIPAATGIEIDEVFDEVTKKNVTVENTSDYSVYVRATYVAYWQSADGSILAEVPELTVENINEADWESNEDGYWYYKEILSAGDQTSNFINELSAEAKDGYTLVIDVIAETVQASPAQAVIDVWGFTPVTTAAE